MYTTVGEGVFLGGEAMTRVSTNSFLGDGLGGASARKEGLANLWNDRSDQILLTLRLHAASLHTWAAGDLIETCSCKPPPHLRLRAPEIPAL